MALLVVMVLCIYHAQKLGQTVWKQTQNYLERTFVMAWWKHKHVVILYHLWYYIWVHLHSVSTVNQQGTNIPNV